MVNRPQGSEGPPGSAHWSHDWTTLDDYLTRHDGHMARLQAMGIVVEDTLSFTRRRSRDAEPLRIQINGRVRCSQGVTLEVDKWLRVRRRHDNRLEVRGFSYSYHAWIEDSRRDLLRYDNAHGELHRHFFDGEGIEVAVTPIDLDQLPTLDAVIEEAVRLARER